MNFVFPSTPIVIIQLLTYLCVFLVYSFSFPEMTLHVSLSTLVTSQDQFTPRAPAIIYPIGSKRRTLRLRNYAFGPMLFVVWHREMTCRRF